jgi:hypothetical protein
MKNQQLTSYINVKDWKLCTYNDTFFLLTSIQHCLGGFR